MLVTSIRVKFFLIDVTAVYNLYPLGTIKLICDTIQCDVEQVLIYLVLKEVSLVIYRFFITHWYMTRQLTYFKLK